MLALSVTETQATDNGQTSQITPAMWHEYEIEPLYLGGVCYTGIWLTEDGAVLGKIRWDAAFNEWNVKTALDSYGEYLLVPGATAWEAGIIRDLSRAQNPTEGIVIPPPTKQVAA